MRAQGRAESMPVERITTDRHGPRRLQLGIDGRTARHFGDAGQAVVGDDLDDGAQTIRGMETGGVEQRRIAQRDGGDDDVRDAHKTIPLRALSGR